MGKTIRCPKCKGQNFQVDETWNGNGIHFTISAGVMPDEAESLQWLGKAAEAGHAEAQYTLGFQHANGQGAPSDDEAAMRWFQKAALRLQAAADPSSRLRPWAVRQLTRYGSGTSLTHGQPPH